MQGYLSSRSMLLERILEIRSGGGGGQPIEGGGLLSLVCGLCLLSTTTQAENSLRPPNLAPRPRSPSADDALAWFARSRTGRGASVVQGVSQPSQQR